MIALDHITHRYGHRTALRELSLRADGEIYGILGNNGAGKSTLMKIVGTVLTPSAGEIRVDGFARPRDDLAIRAGLGYLPQEYGLPPHMTARSFLNYASALKGLDPTDAGASPDLLLERVGLADVANRPIGSFSGGMRQRLGIAQAFLGFPGLLVLDEPTSGLDPDERVRFRTLVRETQPHATVLLSTHIVSDLERDADRVGILSRGRLVREGTPDALSETARGLVYELSLTPDVWERVSPDWMRRDRDMRRWPGVVANVRADGPAPASVHVRVVSRALPEGAAVPVEPTLEDAYLLAALVDRETDAP